MLPQAGPPLRVNFHRTPNPPAAATTLWARRYWRQEWQSERIGTESRWRHRQRGIIVAGVCQKNTVSTSRPSLEAAAFPWRQTAGHVNGQQVPALT